MSFIKGIHVRIFSGFCLLLSIFAYCDLFYIDTVFAEAKQSTLSVNMTQGILAISLTPSGDGMFGKSSNSSIEISTDNYSGYSMKIVSSGSTSLMNSDNDEIESINSAINESTFSSNTIYNNKWGYVPSQYITENNNSVTVVSNTDYLPAPSSVGDLLAKTSAANSTDDIYTLSFGARVDHQLPPGTYQYAFVLQIVANPIVYNITYNDNTTDTVTNMPSLNPQVVDIDGGTPITDSYAILSDAVPARDGKKFSGWCDTTTTTDSNSGDDICSGNVYLAGENLPIDQTAGPNITLYAIWTGTTYVCKAATVQHTETCNRSDNNGCKGAGYANGATIQYGSLIQPGAISLTPGDALTCDINNDGTFNETDERFYYYATNGDNAELIYYKNLSDAENNYDSGLALLPTSSTVGWTNPGLVVFGASLLNGDYDGKVARFMSYEEIVAACGNSTTDFGVNGKCLYILEKSNFANTDIRDGYWIGRSNHSTRVHTSTRKITDGSLLNGVRPVIEVPLNLIQMPAALDVTNAVIANNNLTVAVGRTLTIQVSNSALLEPYTFSSVDDSIASVDASTGVVTGVSAGTVNIIMTGADSGLTKVIEVEVLPFAQEFTVTFNTNGGSLNDGASNTRNVIDGDEVGVLPTASKTDYKFFGWYTDDGTFYDEVYPEMIVEADITFYAKWEEDLSSFPIIWSEINECIFTGTTVTGTYCEHTNNSSYYIDTDIQLFIAANYNKNFEVGFTITEFDPTSQLSNSGNQATFVSSKKEDSLNNYPGFVIRRYSGTNFIEITSRWKDDAQSLSKNDLPYATTKTVKLQKRKETEQGNDYYRIYYSINGGTWTLYEDVTNKTYFEFNTKIWFGGAANSNGVSPMRPLVGKMTDMYVKLGLGSE